MNISYLSSAFTVALSIVGILLFYIANSGQVKATGLVEISSNYDRELKLKIEAHYIAKEEKIVDKLKPKVVKMLDFSGVKTGGTDSGIKRYEDIILPFLELIDELN